MEQADRQAFASLMYALGAVFGKEITEHMIAGYWLALEDATLEEVATAAKKCMRNSQFMPKPVELQPNRYLVEARKRFARTRALLADGRGEPRSVIEQVGVRQQLREGEKRLVVEVGW